MISGRWFLSGPRATVRLHLKDNASERAKNRPPRRGDPYLAACQPRMAGTCRLPLSAPLLRNADLSYRRRPLRIRIRMNPDLADQNTELKRWIQEDARNPRPIWVAWVKSKDPRDRFCFLGRTPGCVMLGRF